MERSKRLPLELDQCISAVITAMRQNAKWAVVPGNYKVGHTTWPGSQPCLPCMLSAPPVTPPNPPNRRRRTTWSQSLTTRISGASGAKSSSGMVRNICPCPGSRPEAQQSSGMSHRPARSAVCAPAAAQLGCLASRCAPPCTQLASRADTATEVPLQATTLLAA